MEVINKIPSEIFVLILYNIEDMKVKDLINIYYSFYNHRKVIFYELNKYLDFYINEDSELDFDSENSENENDDYIYKNMIFLPLDNIKKEINNILHNEIYEKEKEFIDRKNNMLKKINVDNSNIINTIINCFLKCYICKNNNTNETDYIYQCSHCEMTVCKKCCKKCYECWDGYFYYHCNNCKDDICYTILLERRKKAIENNDEDEIWRLEHQIDNNHNIINNRIFMKKGLRL